MGEKRPINAVDGVHLTLFEGECFGLVGESGSGKTTLIRTLLGKQPESEGTIQLTGRDVSRQSPRVARNQRPEIQLLHQDQTAAFDPWWRIGATLHETLRISGMKSAKERQMRIEEMLAAVDLHPAALRRFPHELSGGQIRRAGLARVLSLRPRIVLLDEPTAGLDLSVQANVLKLCRDLQQRFGLTFLIVSHDLSVVRRICDRTAIMYLGRIVEQGPTTQLFESPRHPYTQILLNSRPSLKHKLKDMPETGEPPSHGKLPSGCRYSPRCAFAADQCRTTEPASETLGWASVACHRWRELAGTAA
ncbi:oligopeptide/dipeptide ABC transporter ATP-binding protein [Mesorhizobium sp. 1B3]|uniref:oligopeptide/dipeptide ABC transporter ATP-binding protein n=1 Tax=Mesorhizobium sp. 1B3 TaxID=3243599 RepID=UPI003D993DA3